MSVTKELHSIRDTFANQSRPSDAFGSHTFLPVRGGSTAQRQPFLAVGAIPRGTRILVARLHMYLVDATTGSRTHTLRRTSARWGARTLTWNNRPATSATNTAATTVGALAAGAEVVFDIALMMQDAADGQPWYGVRMESSEDAPIKYHSYESTKARKRPWLELEWATVPDAPSALLPADGQYTSASRPLVSWLFTDPGDATDVQSAYQVQVATDSLFSVGLFDTAKTTSPQQSVDLAATAYAGAPADSARFWRVRVWDSDDVQSAWSETESFIFHANGTLAITNPPVGATVDDVTPTFTWTLTGATQQAFEVIIERQQSDGTWVEHARSERQTSALTTWTLPEAYALQPSVTYRITLRAWDTFVRVPGVSAYVQAQRTFTYVPVAGITAPTALTAVLETNKASVVLTWQRATTPDYFAIVVDGVIVMPRVEPSSVFVSGTTYSLRYWRATPRVAHTYSVQAVVLTTGSYRHSSVANPTAVATTVPIGITLVDEDTSESVRLFGSDEGQLAAETEEASRIYKPIGRRSGVLVTDTVGGWVGSVNGRLINYDTDPQTARDVFLRLRSPRRHLRLILGDTNIPIKVHALTATPRPDPGDQSFVASFSYFQTGEFDIEWES